MTTEPTSTSMTAGNAADREQLDLARAQGDAYRQALEALPGKPGVTKKRAGQHLIGFAQHEAEGLYGLAGRAVGLARTTTGGQRPLRDRGGRQRRRAIRPGLEVTLTVLSNEGHELIRTALPFLWHPFLHHYGINAEVPGEGPYIVRATIEPPRFMRHDPVNGRWSSPDSDSPSAASAVPPLSPAVASRPMAGAGGDD